jgi:4a-hydroxytetrahydrobiopterin dehydratase
MAELLSDDEIAEELPDGWRHEGDEIRRTFEFDDYLDGVAFASEVGELAEEEFHHPEITIGYEEVTVSFTSHEEGGVTNADIRLARATNQRR